MSYSRLFGEWLALLAAASLFVVLAVAQNWSQRVDATLLDHSSPLILSEPSEEIVIIEIDDRSVGGLGNWPWDRRLHAELLEKLSDYDPELVLYDVLFIEPTNPASDDRFTRALLSSGNVLLAHTFDRELNTVEEMVTALPFEPFADAALASGHVAVSADKDGIVRRFDMNLRADGRNWPHLALVALREMRSDQDLSDISFYSPIVPMHENGAFRTVSAIDIISGNIPDEYINGKLVLIGATAQGLGDRYSVAEHAGRLMTGVEIQANLLSSLMQNETIQLVPTLITQMVLLATLAGLFLAWWQMDPAWVLRVTVLAILSLLALTVCLLIFAKMWLPSASAIAAILIAYPIWGWRRLTAVSRFLDIEAKRLGSSPIGGSQSGHGFDRLAKQVALVSSLVGETKVRLTFLDQVLGAAPDPMMVFNQFGELVLMNQEAGKIFGQHEKLKGSYLAEILKSQDATMDTEKGEVIFPGGRTFLFSKSQYDDELKTQIFSLKDVTAIRNSEKDRAAMLEFLSHDMRSPQVAIVGLSTGKGIAIDEAERFRRIEGQARRTLKLTDDFVQIARLEHSGLELEETDIGALLYEAMDRAYPFARRQNIAFKCEISEEPEFCFVDPLAISRCIDNLVGNALKFSPPETLIALSLSREDKQWISISIADQGPGLPAERLEKPFARFGANDTTAGPSAGLGLAYVKRVIDEHKGEISVSSSSEHGTTFNLRIPCQRDCHD